MANHVNNFYKKDIYRLFASGVLWKREDCWQASRNSSASLAPVNSAKVEDWTKCVEKDRLHTG